MVEVGIKPLGPARGKPGLIVCVSVFACAWVMFRQLIKIW